MVYVKFGNVNTREMEDILGIEFKEDERNWLEEIRIDNAQDVPKGRWHCFKEPLGIEVGDDATANKIIEILEPYSDFMKRKISLGSHGK